MPALGVTVSLPNSGRSASAESAATPKDTATATALPGVVPQPASIEVRPLDRLDVASPTAVDVSATTTATPTNATAAAKDDSTGAPI